MLEVTHPIFCDILLAPQVSFIQCEKGLCRGEYQKGMVMGPTWRLATTMGKLELKNQMRAGGQPGAKEALDTWVARVPQSSPVFSPLCDSLTPLSSANAASYFTFLKAEPEGLVHHFPPGHYRSHASH